MNTGVEPIHVDLTDSDVAQLFQRQDLYPPRWWMPKTAWLAELPLMMWSM